MARAPTAPTLAGAAQRGDDKVRHISSRAIATLRRRDALAPRWDVLGWRSFMSNGSLPLALKSLVLGELKERGLGKLPHGQTKFLLPEKGSIDGIACALRTWAEGAKDTEHRDMANCILGLVPEVGTTEWDTFRTQRLPEVAKGKRDTAKRQRRNVEELAEALDPSVEILRLAEELREKLRPFEDHATTGELAAARALMDSLNDPQLQDQVQALTADALTTLHEGLDAVIPDGALEASAFSLEASASSYSAPQMKSMPTTSRKRKRARTAGNQSRLHNAKSRLIERLQTLGRELKLTHECEALCKAIGKP